MSDINMIFDNNHHFDVTRTIDRIEKTGTSGLVDTYTIYYQDGTTYEYSITNGKDGDTPEFETEAITGGHRLTITLGEHVESVDLMDGAKGDTGDTGPQGERGLTGRRGSEFLQINTNPEPYTTPVGDITPAYRMLKTTVMSESGVSEIFEGDVLERVYYLYPIVYIDSDYVYATGRSNIRGAQGEPGQNGQDGHTPAKGTDYWTASDQASIVQDVLDALDDAESEAY